MVHGHGVLTTCAMGIYVYVCVMTIEKGLVEIEIKVFLYAARVLKKITI